VIFCALAGANRGALGARALQPPITVAAFGIYGPRMRCRFKRTGLKKELDNMGQEGPSAFGNVHGRQRPALSRAIDMPDTVGGSCVSSSIGLLTPLMLYPAP
jgi:hypothetical protein